MRLTPHALCRRIMVEALRLARLEVLEALRQLLQ
jgi:hypothetical protein